MVMTGEKFGDWNTPQVKYLFKLGQWDSSFPSFEHEVEGAEVVDGVYNVLWIKD
jgi:arginine decarboxylase